MGAKTVLVFHSPSGRECPRVVRDFADEAGLALNEIHDRDEVFALVHRSYPAGIVLDTEHENGCIELCRRLKSDPFSAIVPIVMAVRDGDQSIIIRGLEAGMRTIHVGTGSTRPEEVARFPFRPTWQVGSVADLVDLARRPDATDAELTPR